VQLYHCIHRNLQDLVKSVFAAKLESQDVTIELEVAWYWIRQKVFAGV